MISQSIRRRLTASGKVKELTLSKYSETVSPASNYSGLFIYVLYGDEIPTSSPTITNSASSWIYSVNWDSSNGRIVIGYRANEDESNDRTGIITVTYEGKSAQFYLTQSKDYVSESGVLFRGSVLGDSIDSVSVVTNSSYVYTGTIESSKHTGFYGRDDTPVISSVSASYTIKYPKYLANVYASGKEEVITEELGYQYHDVVLSNFDSFGSGTGAENTIYMTTYNYPTSSPYFFGVINLGFTGIDARLYHNYYPSSSKVTISPEFDYSINTIHYVYDQKLVIAADPGDSSGDIRYYRNINSGNGTTYEYQYPLVAVFNNSTSSAYVYNAQPKITVPNSNLYVTVIDSYKNKTASVTARIA